MPPRSPLADCTHMALALTCVLLFDLMGNAQASAPSLESTRQKLATLGTCLGPDNSAIGELTRGLLAGWGQWKSAIPERTGPPSPPPAEYLDSLDRDISACAFAGKIPDDARRQLILRAVSEDIAIKAEDCRRFGMGRSVTLRVTTVKTISLKGPTTENGWEVFYRWICSSDFQPQEIRVPQLSSPAVIQLPPGNYTIRAQKMTSKKQIANAGPVEVFVGLQPAVEVQLPIQ